MGTLGGALRALSPHSLLRLYLAMVVCAAALAIGAVLWATSTVDSRTREAASMANATTAASQVQAGLREPLKILIVSTYGFLLSDSGQSRLLDQQRAQIISLISASFLDPDAEVPLPAVSIPISDREAVALQRSIDLYSAQIDELAGFDGVDLADVATERDRLRASLDAYLDDDSISNFAAVLGGVVSLGAEIDAAQDRLSLGVTKAQVDVANATSRARLVMLLALTSLTALMGVATFFVGRLISRAFQSSETERNALREMTGALQYRNDQLNALYAVFSEITDTLSMHYVISATLRETLRVMNGTIVVLRLLQDGELVVAGNLTVEGKEIPNLPPVPLGEGPTGRVARRGRSTRIDQGAQALVGPSPVPDDPNSGVESGIIVPLIVGARVVGTLAVWARASNTFSDEDERVLEMMASQVATAVVAADHAESSERKALHDPLTGLPNRRQLSEDIANHFDKLNGGGTAAVAMVDVDNFKAVNDEFGHRVGDISLQKIASVLRTAMRDGDLIYRYGGEEFVAIFRTATGHDALVAAERLRAAVVNTPITGDQLETVSPVTISVGLALMPDHGTDINDLIEKADRAMYRAKDAGRNRVEVWEDALGVDATAVA
ncbi:MAG TPA: sensor domain-containing diguanylate cyclase [Dehalococcoidia bacterium]|nr:sensor domain-containing diguanylate cyclase [Dehalococcoidia bacterium]